MKYILALIDIIALLITGSFLLGACIVIFFLAYSIFVASPAFAVIVSGLILVMFSITWIQHRFSKSKNASVSTVSIATEPSPIQEK